MGPLARQVVEGCPRPRPGDTSPSGSACHLPLQGRILQRDCAIVSANSLQAVAWSLAMSGKVKFKSEAFEAIHASASALHKVGPSTRRPCAASTKPARQRRLNRLSNCAKPIELASRSLRAISTPAIALSINGKLAPNAPEA